MKKQIHIGRRIVVYQPLMFAGFMHIPGNLFFNAGAVDCKHISVGVLIFNTGSVHVELTRNYPVHSSIQTQKINVFWEIILIWCALLDNWVSVIV